MWKILVSKVFLCVRIRKWLGLNNLNGNKNYYVCIMDNIVIDFDYLKVYFII